MNSMLFKNLQELVYIDSSKRIENALLTDLEVDCIDVVLISIGKTNHYPLLLLKKNKI